MNNPAGKGLIIPGLIAAPFYLLLIITLGALEPGFSHFIHPMSMLGGIPGVRGLAFNVGVAITGAIVVVFSHGLRRQLPVIPSTKIAFWLLTMGGLGLIGAGVFHCNAGCKNVLAEPDLVGRIHIIVSFLAGFGAGLALFFVWAATRKSKRWQRFALPTLIAAIFANVPGVIFWLSFATGYQLDSIGGLIQRLGLVVTLIWMFYVASGMWSRRP